MLFSSCSQIYYRQHKVPPINTQLDQKVDSLYQDCELSNKLRFEKIKKALHGYEYINFKNSGIITIVDFTRPSTDKRCTVIDIKKRKVIYHTFVAHGKNTGENYAELFSNINNSKQSSLGFYQTSETYSGKHGYSIKLDGLEKDINHHAKKRDIVIHGADYVSQEFIEQNGRLGRSWGCPALPRELSSQIIDVIKGGSCVYIYADDQEYLSKSFYIADSPSLKRQFNK